MAYIAGVNRAVDTGNTYFTEVSKEIVSGSGTAKSKITEREFIAKREIYQGNSLLARIEFSRWLIDCPNCNGAEFFFEDELFICSICKNSDINGNVRRVKMPADKDRKDIEDILSKRAIKNRHWKPGETIDSLKIENLKAGVKL